DDVELSVFERPSFTVQDTVDVISEIACEHLDYASLVANRAGLQRNRARSALSESTGARGELDALLVLEGNAELAVDEIGDGERSSVRAQRRARYDELSAAVGTGAAD